MVLTTLKVQASIYKMPLIDGLPRVCLFSLPLILSQPPLSTSRLAKAQMPAFLGSLGTACNCYQRITIKANDIIINCDKTCKALNWKALNDQQR